MKKCILAISMFLAVVAQAQIKVASLHPLMGDLVKEVGGDRVTVVDIGKVGMEVHTFSPTAKDLQAMATCQLVVASGKGLERYLPALQDSLGAVPILEVGSAVPSRTITEDEVCEDCDEDHEEHEDEEEHVHKAGSVDPHWWHDVSNMERAVKVVEKQLSQMDEEGQDYYSERSKTTRDTYKKLDRWVKGQIATIPKEQRTLVTAHAAMGYFCDAYKMKPVYVMGLSDDHEIPAKQLAAEVKKLAAEKVKAVFPEQGDNPKVLGEVVKQAGAKLGTPLNLDGTAANYDEMMRANVTAIVQGLSQ